jgi:hypothetical protein
MQQLSTLLHFVMVLSLEFDFVCLIRLVILLVLLKPVADADGDGLVDGEDEGSLDFEALGVTDAIDVPDDDPLADGVADEPNEGEFDPLRLILALGVSLELAVPLICALLEGNNELVEVVVLVGVGVRLLVGVEERLVELVGVPDADCVDVDVVDADGVGVTLGVFEGDSDGLELGVTDSEAD